MEDETGLDNCIVKTDTGVTIQWSLGFLAKDFSINIFPQLLRNSGSQNYRVGRIFQVGYMSQEETNNLLSTFYI